MLLVLLGCVPAGVYGLRFDGTMPLNTEAAVVGGVFPGAASDTMPLSDTAVVGLQGRQRLGRDVAVQLGAGVAATSLDAAPVGVAELELQGRVLREAPVTLSLRGGVDMYGQWDAESVTFGLHGGAVVSRHVGAQVRPYAGFTVNPMLVPGDGVYPWFQYGGGVSWRPHLDESTRGLLALEVSGYHGFGADVLDHEDLTTWGLMLQLGASFGNAERE